MNSRYFSEKEIACRCGCGTNKATPELLDLLDLIRDALGRPMIVTSVYRCVAHNAAVGGAPDSAHVHGKAADISTGSSGATFSVLEAVFSLGVRRIGIHEDFIHIDIDETKPQKVVFLYGSRGV